MTPRELSNKWLHRIGYKLVSPETRKRNDDLAPVLPFVVLDIYHDYFRKGLTPEKFTQRQKQLLKRAAASYSRLNKVFFSAFAPSEYEDVTDLMDSLQEYAKKLSMLKPNQGLDRQSNLSRLYTHSFPHTALLANQHR